MEGSGRHRLRDLPSVAAALESAAAAPLIERFGRLAATTAIRAALAEARLRLRAGKGDAIGAEALAAAAFARLDAEDRSGLRPLYNLTGAVLHTNLGRAQLAEVAIGAAVAAMREAVALEFDLETGRRGERDDHLRGLLRELTGAEDATIVNNNAAAVLLCLNAFANGREAIVSRGELIEIGGSFRMPQIMARAGAKLVEVGATNRTRLEDYREALTPQTGLILKVHPSNYRIEGFTGEAPAPALAALAREAGVPLMNDLGSGSLLNLSAYGLKKEPTVREALQQGADLVTFSGDKLLGGPQAGFIVGRAALVEIVNRNPLKRALRVDKIRLAALEATLKLYRDPGRLAQRLPTLRFLSRPQADIAAAAARLAPRVAAALGPGFAVATVELASEVGSGALPLDTIPSAGLALRPRAGGGRGSGHALERLALAMRGLERPVIGRLREGALTLDLRCLDDEEGFIGNLAGLARDALV